MPCQWTAVFFSQANPLTFWRNKNYWALGVFLFNFFFLSTLAKCTYHCESGRVYVNWCPGIWKWRDSLYITNIKERKWGSKWAVREGGGYKVWYSLLFPSAKLLILAVGELWCCVWESCMLPSHFTFAKGEMKLVMQTRPASANSLATSAIRRIFSSLSQVENPRFLLRPWRMLSPSRE